MRRLLLGVALVLGGSRAYRFYASGAVTIDSGVGRRVRALGPVTWEIAADRETVFEVIASPYLGKMPRSMKNHLHVWERGTDMVLAAHYTKVKCGVTSTVETVHFARPDRINFRLVRGPVSTSGSPSSSKRPTAAQRSPGRGNWGRTSRHPARSGATSWPDRGRRPSARP